MKIPDKIIGTKLLVNIIRHKINNNNITRKKRVYNVSNFGIVSVFHSAALHCTSALNKENEVNEKYTKIIFQ